MSKDTLLKKEFSEKDLQRIRNIAEKRFGDSTGIQLGYTKQEQEHIEGDEWEENGKKWTIRGGIKQTVTRLDSMKRYASFPLTCPCCEKHFKLTDLNKKMYNIHEKCFDCVIDMETKLKLEGKFEEYEKNLMSKNRDSHLVEFEKALDEYANSTNPEFYTEDGQKESWQGSGVDKEYIKAMKEQIKELKSKEL